MKIYIIYQIQPCQFLILVLYCSVCAGSVRCKTVTSMLAFAGSDTLTRDKMEKGTRDLIAKQMDVFMLKFPNASLQQIRDFLFSGQSGDEDLNTVGKNTLFRFIQRMKKKFIQTGSCLVRRPGSGRPAAVVGDKKLANQVSRKFLNKETPGQRSVAEMFNISRTSVMNILKTKNIKPYHKVREQALKPEHKEKRVKIYM